MNRLSLFWDTITNLKFQSPIYLISEAELAERETDAALRKGKKVLDTACLIVGVACLVSGITLLINSQFPMTILGCALIGISYGLAWRAH